MVDDGKQGGVTYNRPRETSGRQFAELVGVTDATVQTWKNRGYLYVTERGKIDIPLSSKRLAALSKISHCLVTGQRVNPDSQVYTRGRRKSGQKSDDEVLTEIKREERTGEEESPDRPTKDPNQLLDAPPAKSQPEAPKERGPGVDPYIDELNQRLDRGEMLSIGEASQVKENYLARQRRLQYEREESAVVEVDAAVSILQESMGRVRQRLLAMPTKVAPRLVNQPKAPPIEDMVREEVTEVLEELSRMDVNELLQSRSR